MIFFHGSPTVNVLAAEGIVVLELRCLVDLSSLNLQVLVNAKGR